ncbi:MAG: glycosyltransferase family 39 protein [Planctomycetota bacterium]|nr:glycosyltransferase family 39 protein [Planctomycetota bacterium]
MNAAPADLEAHARAGVGRLMALPFFLPFALYARSLSYGLLGVDDEVYYRANQALHGGAWAGLAGCFRWFYSEYFPVTQLTIWFDLAVFGDGSWWGPRLHQLCWFGLCALAVQSIVRKLTGRPRLALFVALLFAAHPAAASSVEWLANRKTVVSMALAFWSLERYLAFRLAAARGERRAAYAAALALAGLALLAKPHAVALPLLVLAGEYILCRVSWREALRDAAPFAGLTAAFLVFTAFSGVRSDLTNVPLGGSALAALSGGGPMLLRYLLNALAPVELAFYYAVPEPSAADPWHLLAWALVLALPLWTARRGPEARRRAGAWWLGCAGLLPALNLVPQPVPMADHYLLWALPGWLLLWAWACDAWLDAVRRASVRTGLSLAAIAACAVLTLLRVPSFATPETLFRQNAEKEPGAALAWINLGFALAARHDASLAPEIEQACEQALAAPDARRMLPAQKAFALKRALPALYRAGRKEEAQALMAKVLDGDPQAEHPAIRAARAEILARTGDSEGALNLAEGLRPAGLAEALARVHAACRDGARLPNDLPPQYEPPEAGADGFDRRAVLALARDVLRVTAAARIQQQRWEDAFDAAALLVNLSPGDPGPRVQLSGICRKLGMEETARRLTEIP